MDRFNDVLRTASEKLASAYVAYFDIKRDYRLGQTGQAKQIVVPVFGEFHARKEKYVLMKKAIIGVSEGSEYLFILSFERIDEQAFQAIVDIAKVAERELVKPHGEHMYSYISMVVLCGSIDESVARKVKKFSQYKMYRFWFHGYSVANVVAVVLDSDNVGGGKVNIRSVVSNRDGKSLKNNVCDILSK
ncbi:hypothetical protein RsTz2092_12690 [Deferribacterales bacterium RsTz2092]|nr:hypothetical protein AGMMS49941_06360 [Deferribacterales bacterium]GHU85858.1 hypothetical protein AGMMS49941_06410 [Deferribacterales bacterium]